MLILWFAVLTSELCLVASESDPEKWDMLVFAQGWPPSECVFLENLRIKCAIPGKVSSWLAHGLWPTLSGTNEPVNCNPQWLLNVSDLTNLRPELDLRWANLRLGSNPEKKNEDLWKHEWRKHGTCAASQDSLRGPLRYFNGTLGLWGRFDLLTLLEKDGIAPSATKTYDYEKITKAVAKATGVPACLVCEKKKGTEEYFLFQIEIWMNKSFMPIACDDYDVRKHGGHRIHQLRLRSAMHVGSDDTPTFTPILSSRSHCPRTGIRYPPVHSNPLSY